MLFLQVIGWIVAFLIFFIYLLSRLGNVAYVLAISLSSFASFILIIYGYAFYLYPRFYRRKSRGAFIGAVFLFFCLVLALRVLAEWTLVAPLAERSSIFNLGRTHLLYDLFSSFFAMVVGILLVSVFDNLARERREVILRRKQSEAELNLLKAQLQPHFLFNSLNNLYYDVYKSQPEVANRIAMLSDIMRYFMEQSPEERVLLRVELDFIKAYIELEKVRLPHQLNLDFEVKASEGIMLPPMLLMPLVENLFKHGININRPTHDIRLSVRQLNNDLIFTVTNPTRPSSTEGIRTGVGLRNLRERLTLLYGDRFSLWNQSTEETYTAQLTIPIS